MACRPGALRWLDPASVTGGGRAFELFSRFTDVDYLGELDPRRVPTATQLRDSAGYPLTLEVSGP